MTPQISPKATENDDVFSVIHTVYIYRADAHPCHRIIPPVKPAQEMFTRNLQRHTFNVQREILVLHIGSDQVAMNSAYVELAMVTHGEKMSPSK